MRNFKYLAATFLAVQAGAAFAASSIDLSGYTLVGRYALPEPKTVTAPTGSLLAQEASGITYNWDTGTLFIVGDGGTSIVQVNKTGQLIDSMTLAQGSSPQGTAFYDPEGIAYIGDGKFVFTEERYRIANLIDYKPGTTAQYSDAKQVKLGTTIGNIGLEGLTYDPSSDSYIFVKEASPEGLFQTTLNFANGTASNGSPSTVNSANLFDPAKLGLADFADIYALSNLKNLTGAATGNLVVLSQESGKLVETDRLGNIISTLDIASFVDPSKEPNSIADKQFEGLTFDAEGYLYITTENGGGGIDFPQLFVLKPLHPISAPVPEPATWAMMIGGFAFAGAAMRRRKTAIRFA